MKKLLSIVTIALLIVLAACNNNVKSNARAVASNYSIASNSVTLKIEVRDPELELTNRVVDIKVIDTAGKETVIENETIEGSKSRTFEFKNLEREMEYTLVVTGTKDEKDFELLRIKAAFKTLAQGDVATDPILISTLSQFKEMNSKKHYKLANDLDFSGEELAPLFQSGTPFNGTFDGAGFKISNINIVYGTSSTTGDLSVFGVASKSTIKNVTFDKIKINNSVKPNNTKHYVGIVVSNVTSNDFVLNNVNVTNSEITINHNVNKVTTNRDLYAGLLGGFIQGRIENVSISSSKLNVVQGGVNYISSGSSSLVENGTYVGGAIGLFKVDTGMVISKLSVQETDINVTVNQDKKASNPGVLYVGGVFGGYRSNKKLTEVYSSANIKVEHNKFAATEDDKLDSIYVGGIAAIIQKANAENLLFAGSIDVTLSNAVKVLHTALITPNATQTVTNTITSGSIKIKTGGLQQSYLAEVYNLITNPQWNKYSYVYVTDTATASIDENELVLTNYQVKTIADVITSEYITNLLKK